MIALSSPERARLIGILGMLGSDHDGERASAALLATRMMKDRGITWSDLIGQPETSRRREDDSAGWRGDLALALRHISLCRLWEQDFVQSVSCRTRLSEKQRFILSEIAAGLRNRGKA